MNDSNIEYRVIQLEEDVKSVAGEQRKMSDAILMFGVKLENSILTVSDKIREFQERRNFWNKVLIGVVTAGVLALLTQMLRIGNYMETHTQ